MYVYNFLPCVIKTGFIENVAIFFKLKMTRGYTQNILFPGPNTVQHGAHFKTKYGFVSYQMTHQWPQPKPVLVTVREKQTRRETPTMATSGGRWSSENRSIVLTCRSSDRTCGSSHMEVSERTKISFMFHQRLWKMVFSEIVEYNMLPLTFKILLKQTTL